MSIFLNFLRLLFTNVHTKLECLLTRLEKLTWDSSLLQNFINYGHFFLALDPVMYISNLYTLIIYKCLLYTREFVPGKPFQPSRMFASKAGAYHSEAPSGAPGLTKNISGLYYNFSRGS